MKYFIFVIAAMILFGLIYYCFYDLKEAKRLAKEYNEMMNELERIQNNIDRERNAKADHDKNNSR